MLSCLEINGFHDDVKYSVYCASELLQYVTKLRSERRSQLLQLFCECYSLTSIKCLTLPIVYLMPWLHVK